MTTFAVVFLALLIVVGAVSWIVRGYRADSAYLREIAEWADSIRPEERD